MIPTKLAFVATPPGSSLQKGDALGMVIGAIPLPAIAISLLATNRVPELLSASIFLCAVLCMLYMALNAKYLHRPLFVFFPMFVLSIFYFLDTINNPTENGIKHAVAISCVIAIIAFYINFSSILLRSNIFRSALLIEAMALVGAGMLGLNQKNFDMGAVLYASCTAYYLYIYDKPHQKRIFSSLLFFVFLSYLGISYDFRALIYLSFTIFGLFTIFNVAQYNRFRPLLMFTFLISAMSLFFYFYIHIDDFEITQQLNLLTQDKTGRQLTSGRQDLWPFILDYAMNTPIYGAGGGVLPKDFLSADFSSHNYYLQLFLQKGLIGLFLIFIFTMNIWNLMNRAQWGDARVNFSASVFLAFLVHNVTEVLMFQNALMVSIPAWIVISFGAAEPLETARNALPSFRA
ncbi:MAG: O-antigen ligase family protein [Nevskia sp.]|nr:O-antigen ligase family protein [Nevskia sp.]